MSAVYASTTRRWFDELALIKPERVAFWQPTPARPARIAPGERWYFKELGSPRILGYGEFVDWEQLSAHPALFTKTKTLFFCPRTRIGFKQSLLT